MGFPNRIAKVILLYDSCPKRIRKIYVIYQTGSPYTGKMFHKNNDFIATRVVVVEIQQSTILEVESGLTFNFFVHQPLTQGLISGQRHVSHGGERR